MLKLTRKMELYLIDLGLQHVIENMMPKPIVKKEIKKESKKTWSMTPEQRKAHAARMKKVWADKRKNS